MAYDGELVKMGNGRWARFQHCRICNAGHQDQSDYSLLVAVELDEQAQELLNNAERSLDTYRRQGINAQLTLDPESQDQVHIRFETGSASLH